ncbi:hypothetical protein [Halorientalis halophila]|uniref:hypothetical protein n=1 Tax=Halorientalis halophila TaxID=3108499 RepID=UPI003009D9FD
MTRRRALLGALALASVGTLAGCAGDSTGRGEDTPTAGTNRRERGAADPVSASRTYDRSRYAFLDDRHAVRYAATGSAETPIPTGTPEYPEQYATSPFEEWGRTNTASVAADRVGTVLEDRGFGSVSVGYTLDHDEYGFAANVDLTTTLARDGRVLSTPEPDFDPVVEATPRSVDVTVRLADQEYSRSVPVWVAETTEQEQ